MRADVYTTITNKIIADLEDGVRPWYKPWNATNVASRVTRPLRHNGIPYTGINVISLWSDYTPVPECHEFVPVYSDAEDGVVTSRYKTWPKEFIYFERDKPEAAHSDLPPHRHSHIKFIARKPAPARETT